MYSTSIVAYDVSSFLILDLALTPPAPFGTPGGSGPSSPISTPMWSTLLLPES